MIYAAHSYALRTCEHPTRRELFGSAVLLSDRGDKLPLHYPRHERRPLGRSDGCYR